MAFHASYNLPGDLQEFIICWWNSCILSLCLRVVSHRTRHVKHLFTYLLTYFVYSLDTESSLNRSTLRTTETLSRTITSVDPSPTIYSRFTSLSLLFLFDKITTKSDREFINSAQDNKAAVWWRGLWHCAIKLVSKAVPTSATKLKQNNNKTTLKQF